MAPPHFLPIESKKGGKVSYIKNKEAMCLSEKQANTHLSKANEKRIIVMVVGHFGAHAHP